jgi:hypothetical protein
VPTWIGKEPPKRGSFVSSDAAEALAPAAQFVLNGREYRGSASHHYRKRVSRLLQTIAPALSEPAAVLPKGYIPLPTCETKLKTRSQPSLNDQSITLNFYKKDSTEIWRPLILDEKPIGGIDWAEPPASWRALLLQQAVLGAFGFGIDVLNLVAEEPLRAAPLPFLATNRPVLPSRRNRRRECGAGLQGVSLTSAQKLLTNSTRNFSDATRTGSKKSWNGIMKKSWNVLRGGICSPRRAGRVQGP